MVGANRLRSATIQTSASFAEMTSNAFDVKVASVSVGKITPDGFVITNTTQGAVTPEAGLLIFNTATNKLNFYDGSAWRIVTNT
jgi:hypothetical protein